MNLIKSLHSALLWCSHKHDNVLPYSLKFSRLKNFAGQRTDAKISPVKFQVHNRCKVRLEARPQNFYPRKFVFVQNLAKPRNILSFRLYGSFGADGLSFDP